MIHFPILRGNEASKGVLPGALGYEDEAVVCPTTSWLCFGQSQTAFIVKSVEV